MATRWQPSGNQWFTVGIPGGNQVVTKKKGGKVANRRMFSKELIQSDKFFSMSIKSQLLYFHIGLLVDDDGFSNNYRMYMNVINADEENLYELQKLGYIYVFESGVLVVRDFLQSNQLRKDRYNETIYKDELSLINVRNKRYYINEKNMATIWQPDGNQVATDGLPLVNTDKIRLDKISLDKKSSDKDSRDVEVKDENHEFKNNSENEDEEIKNNNSKKLSKESLEKILDKWNNLDVNIPKVQALNSNTQRYQMLRARINEHGLEKVLEAIDKIKDSNFLKGYVNDFRITIDWFVKPTNFIKVLEGNYSDKVSEQEEYINNFTKGLGW